MDTQYLRTVEYALIVILHEYGTEVRFSIEIVPVDIKKEM
jgi:hypothetical protein